MGFFSFLRRSARGFGQTGAAYAVDQFDEVVKLEDIPQSSVGAPIPLVLASENSVFVAYYLQNTPKEWDGRTVKIVSSETTGEPSCLIRFDLCTVHVFGPPNDEAFAGHPLTTRGLRPYSAYEVVNSSWLRNLERMNSVHPYHNKTRFMNGRRHFILTFHDSTFECIAEGFAVENFQEPVADVIAQAIEQLRG